MKFIVEPKILKDALSKNDKLVGGLNFDNCILTTENKDNLSVYSNSAYCWIKTLVPAKILKTGKVHTQSGVLSGLKLTGKEVEFSTNSDSKLEFKCGRTKGFLNTNPETNSNLSTPPKEIKLNNKFQLKVFKELVTALSYNADIIEVDDVKPISIRSDGKHLRMSTHDNYCLGYIQLAHEGIQKFEAVLPFKLLSDLISYATQDFEFGIGDDAVRIKTNEIDIIHSFTKPTQDLVDMDAQLEAIKKEKVSSEIVIAGDEAKRFISDELVSFSFNETVDAKIELKGNSQKKLCNIKLNTSHGGIDTSFKVTSMKNEVDAKVSLWLFASFLEQTIGEVTIKFYSNKILITDGKRYYVMPVLK